MSECNRNCDCVGPCKMGADSKQASQDAGAVIYQARAKIDGATWQDIPAEELADFEKSPNIETRILYTHPKSQENDNG